MVYSGPDVFLAPYGSDAALENFQRTVLNGISTEGISTHTDRSFEDGNIRVWGTKETVEGSWKKVTSGDYLLFYRDGLYTHAVRVLGTEKNADLGREIWPNYESGSPWVCVIYLDEPNEINVDSSVVHGLAGDDIDYTMGFRPLSDIGTGGIRGKYGSVEAFANSDTSEKSAQVNVDKSLSIDIPAKILSDLQFPEDQDSTITNQISSALNTGKHVILTGPPGTGKTEIARSVCAYLADEYDSQYTGYQMTTATADWSTFETVGGYMPKEGDSDLRFEPGQVLRRFKQDGMQRNELLIVDEINRSDIDKSFGQLFTLLSGQGVQLPFKSEGEEIEIHPGKKFEGELKPHQYVKPASWRLFATMNSYDKTSLYELSYAFMRRFSFIHVPAPTIPETSDKRTTLMKKYASVWGLSPTEETIQDVSDVWYAANTAIQDRKIGPAIVKDILSHVGQSPDDHKARKRALTQAISNYLYPQLEGVPRRKQMVERIVSTGVVNGSVLRRLAGDILGVEIDTNE